jgi:hypothetical protein
MEERFVERLSGIDGAHYVINQGAGFTTLVHIGLRL